VKKIRPDINSSTSKNFFAYFLPGMLKTIVYRIKSPTRSMITR